MAKYRKKPVVIDAVQWTGDNKAEVYDFVGNKELIHETEQVGHLSGDL